MNDIADTAKAIAEGMDQVMRRARGGVDRPESADAAARAAEAYAEALKAAIAAQST